MNIIQSWKESLGILKPENLKLFVLVTIKTVFDVYKSINRPLAAKGNWLIAVIIVLLAGIGNITSKFGFVFFEGIIVNGIYHALLFFFILGIRPSIEIKNGSYFYYKTIDYWYLLVITIVLGLLPVYVIPLLFVYYSLFLIFALDSFSTLPALFTSLKNAGIMLGYNLPIFLVVYVITAFLNYLLHLLVAFALGYFGGLTFATILYCLFIPIEVALIVNIYIKLIHSQPSLYFKQPE